MTKKLLLSLLVVGLLGLGVGTAKADTILSVGATQYWVGDWNPSNPNGAADITKYLNDLISISAGGTGTADGQTFSRVGSTLTGLPALTANIVEGNINNLTGIVLTGAAYIVAKYDGQNDFTQVWYLNGPATIDIPDKDNGYGISGYEIYYTSSPVPEPTTLALLGSGLAALGAALRRRKQSKIV